MDEEITRSEELKKCSVCGGNPILGMHKNTARCLDSECCMNEWMNVKDWQSRPIEDKLNQENDELKETSLQNIYTIEDLDKALKTAEDALDECKHDMEWWHEQYPDKVDDLGRRADIVRDKALSEIRAVKGGDDG